MAENFDDLAGVDPATNPRFKLMPNGQYAEQMANQVQLFWDPVTQEGRAIFNSQPYLNLGGTYAELQAVPDILVVDLINKLGTCYGKGLIDPVYQTPLDKISVAGISILMSAAFDIETKARAEAQAAAAAAAAEAAAAAAAAASGASGSNPGTGSSGSGTFASGGSPSGSS
jgi:hypothetical protein